LSAGKFSKSKKWTFLVFSFGEEKLVVPLIATPDVDNANRRQEKGKKLNYKARVICIQNGIVFIFLQTTWTKL
jgi:hypothetical protein